MITANPTLCTNARARVARERYREAYASLSACRLCARQCGVNRLKGEKGYCGLGADARVFSAQVEVGDESELTPTFALAFSGCSLRCAFCVSAAETQAPDAGEPMNARKLQKLIRAALGRGAKTVMFLGGEPSINLPQALELITGLPDAARIVWKTNTYAPPQARQWLDGLVDIWLADYKFGNNACALSLAQAPDYTSVVREYLHWTRGHGRTIIRHLLLPGHVRCCWAPVAAWISRNLPDVHVSLRMAFWPREKCPEHPELERTVTEEERQLALDIGHDYHLRFIT